MDNFIEEMIFFFTEVSVVAKALSFWFMRDVIEQIFNILESNLFVPTTQAGLDIIEGKKNNILRFWKLVAAVSYTSNLTHVFSPLFAHLFFGEELVLPVSKYSFFSDRFIRMYIYPLYFYQSFGMHFIMLHNVNTDTFILGLLMLSIAQLDILDNSLRSLTDEANKIYIGTSRIYYSSQKIEKNKLRKLNKCIVHFEGVAK